MESSREPILLFDGDCGLCSRLVRLVLRADGKGALRFASLQGEYARELLARHPELQGVDSIGWVEAGEVQERVAIRSEAILRLVHYLGFPWRTLGLTRVIPRPIRDRLYDWVARRRHRWYRDAVACRVSAEDERRRMIG